MMSPLLADAEKLVPLITGGDAIAWKQWMDLVWPYLVESAYRNRSLKNLPGLDDHAAEVASRVIERLKRDNFRPFTLYFSWKAQHPDKQFDDWLRIVLGNVARDYLREVFGRTDPKQEKKDGEQAPNPRKLLAAYAIHESLENMGNRPPMTAQQTALQLMEYAQSRLPGDQAQALKLWLEGASFEEIEDESSPESRPGADLVRSAVASLRRAFRGENG